MVGNGEVERAEGARFDHADGMRGPGSLAGSRGVCRRGVCRRFERVGPLNASAVSRSHPPCSAGCSAWSYARCRFSVPRQPSHAARLGPAPRPASTFSRRSPRRPVARRAPVARVVPHADYSAPLAARSAPRAGWKREICGRLGVRVAEIVRYVVAACARFGSDDEICGWFQPSAASNRASAHRISCDFSHPK
jgi:hypothetical protein